MYRLMRFYNQNRRKIIKTILILVLFIIVLRLINNYTKNRAIQNRNSNYSIENNIIKSLESDKSLLTGETINSKVLYNEGELIERFLNYCKSYDIENAYNLISDSCKEQQFPTKEDFNTIYISRLFNTKDKIYKIENWNDTTYKIIVEDNALSSGRNVEYNQQDYITVVSENNEKKLNINGYVKEKKINIEKEFDELAIKVLSQYQYMDYTEFTIEVRNKTEYKILIDNLKNINSTYIQDRNYAKYNLYTHELVENDLLILPQKATIIKLKFYSKKISGKTINKIAFDNVILNYGYQKNEKTLQCYIDI